MSDFSASAVEFDITPPVGGFMEGYAAREGTSQGVHDALKGQALFLKCHTHSILLITLDLLGVPLEYTRTIRARVEAATGIPANRIMLACSHTHAGPAGFLTDLPGLHNEADLELQAVTRDKIVDAARQAQTTLQPVTWGVAHGRVSGIGANRNDPTEGPQDDEVITLRLDDVSGDPLAVMMSYGCHPTILGHENLLISADFPGAARRALQAIYPHTTFLFANGASGDISTRFTRRDQTFAEVERAGRILAGEVLRAMQTVETKPGARLGGEVLPLALPFRAFPSQEQAEQETAARRAELEQLEAKNAPHGEIRRTFTRLQGAEAQVQIRLALEGKTAIQTELQALFLDDLAWIGLPGEPFTRIVQTIKNRSPFEHTAVVSYANDEAGYFPDEAAYQEKTYEALISPYREDIATMITHYAIELLEKMHHV
jgi:neutral ceramidase